MPLIETLILSGTALTLGAYVLAAKIVKWDFETEAKFAPPPPPPPPEPLMDPALARAARAAIAERRRILLLRRAEYTPQKGGGWSDGNWKGLTDVDNKLTDLAKEEAKIPLYKEEKKT